MILSGKRRQELNFFNLAFFIKKDLIIIGITGIPDTINDAINTGMDGYNACITTFFNNQISWYTWQSGWDNSTYSDNQYNYLNNEYYYITFTQ